MLPALVWLCLTAITSALAGERVTLNFDPDWKFIKADPTNAFCATLDDHDWTSVSLPHTYNDTDTFDDFSLPGHRGEQNQWGGRTWYRKSFTLPQSYAGKKIYIEFEAARQVAEVYLNGHFLGVSKTGFIPFGFDLTPWLRYDAPNVLAVMCDNRFMKDPLADEGANGGPSLAEIEPAGGLGWLSPGQSAWTDVTFEPGTYAAVCFVFDPETGMPHLMLGMVEVFTVGEGGTPAATPAG